MNLRRRSKPPYTRGFATERSTRSGKSTSTSGSPHNDRSLFGEILDWMLAPLLLIWPMSIAATYLIAQSIAAAPFDQALEASTHVLAQQLRPYDKRVGFELPMAAHDILHADSADHTFYQVWGIGGELLGGDADVPVLPNDHDTPYGVVRFRNAVMRGQEVRIASLYVDFGARYQKLPDARPALVQVAETLEKRSQLANEIIKGVNLPQFLILPIAVVLVWAGLSHGIRPLLALAHQIRARRPDDLSPISPSGAPEEVVPLVEAFNDMLERVGNSVSAQQRFIADAAHQMKTPLAGLRTQAELALRQDDPDELKRSLRQLATSSERATHLINQLLALARAEGQADERPTFEVLDLNEVVRTAAVPFFELAWEKRIDLGFEAGPQPVLVRGQRVLLAELVKNLVDNALRYTPPQGTVTIRVRGMHPTRALIEIEDSGPGIPAAERELVFERFYRVLGSGQDGSGLGLAIVREIAQQHGAEVHVGALHAFADAELADVSPGCVIVVEFPRETRTRLSDVIVPKPKAESRAIANRDATSSNG